MTPRVPFTSVLLMIVVIGVIGAPRQVRGQEAEPVDAKIVSIDDKCRAQIKKHNSPSWRPLDRAKSVWLPLTRGDQLQCLGDGQMEILIPTGKTPVRKSPNPYQVAAIQEDTKPNAIAEELSGLGLVGATRGRSADSRIFWPADGSAVIPEHFEVRWAPVEKKITLTIMSEAKDRTIWGLSEVDGKTGNLKNEALSAALSAYRIQPGGSALVLTLTIGEASDWEESHFSLLNGREQEELNAQLEYWAAHTDGLALHLGWGYSFSRHRLFAEAAEEYEAALRSAPDSPYVLKDAMRADRLAGEATRAKELQLRLGAKSTDADR
jgi:hypothetical protein